MSSSLSISWKKLLAENGWKNRIVGHGVKPAMDFLANPRNWRLHPRFQQEALKGAMDEVGWVDDVTENINTGAVVDGHLRVTLALREGDNTPVPFKTVDLNEAEEAYVLATKDPIGAMAAADKEQLDNLLREVQSEDSAVQQMLADIAKKEGLYAGELDVQTPSGIETGDEPKASLLSQCPKCGFEFKATRLSGDNNPQWKGDNVKYSALHEYMRKICPKPDLCESCKDKPPMDLANKSGEYTRDVTDWEWLCRSCHMKKDGRMDNLQPH